jgi:hypothetical protein
MSGGLVQLLSERVRRLSRRVKPDHELLAPRSPPAIEDIAPGRPDREAISAERPHFDDTRAPSTVRKGAWALVSHGSGSCPDRRRSGPSRSRMARSRYLHGRDSGSSALRCEAEVGEGAVAVPVVNESHDLALTDLEQVRAVSL